MELLLPRTDGGVVAQAVLLLVLAATGLWATRRQPDVRVLVVGVALVLAALMGLRAAH